MEKSTKNKTRTNCLLADRVFGEKPMKLPSLGDLVFERKKGKGVDVTALICGDPPKGRSAYDLLSRKVQDPFKGYVMEEYIFI
ncbi:hypothetical protein WJT86_10055 [Microvirga sp. W0021]|uniref:Uncharacterized protein n=1 Tax=Hohaiivirga grylli TaxID=3133970 RepID=A0ABV0BKC9_9HYPH